MAKYFWLFSTVIVTSSFSVSVQSQILSNFKIIKLNTKNDAKNDWSVDENTRRNQREFVIKKGHSQDFKVREGLKTISKINQQLSTLQDLIQYGVKYQNKISNGPLEISLQLQQIQRIDQTFHYYNPNIYFPDVINRLENNTSGYKDTPSKINGKPFQLDESVESIFLNNILRKNLENQIMAHKFRTKDSSPDKIQRTRKFYLYEDGDEVDPGDGEGWYNYPITRPSCPNPAWHLSTIRWIYQKPRIFKRSPKKKNPKKKKNRDERKKFNKKKRCRRKMRIIISKKDKPKKKKGDGSYRGGKGRKPRLHKKLINGTWGETNSSESISVERKQDSEGPVADAYIDYDSSYVPPSKEENENGTEKIVKKGSDIKKKDKASEEDEESSSEDDDNEDDEDESEDEEKDDADDDDDDDDVDGSHDELMSEAYEPSFNIENEHKNATKHARNNGNSKQKEAMSNKNLQSKTKTLRAKQQTKNQKQIFEKKLNYKTKELDSNVVKRFRKKSKLTNEEIKKSKDHLSKIEHEGENIRLHESKKAQYTLLHTEETLLNQIMKQQLQNNLKHSNRHATILLPSIEEFISEDKNQLKKSTKVNLGNINHPYVNKVVELKKDEVTKTKHNMQENGKDVMEGSLSDITQNLLKNTILHKENDVNIKSKNKIQHINGLNKQRIAKISHQRLTDTMTNRQVQRL